MRVIKHEHGYICHMTNEEYERAEKGIAVAITIGAIMGSSPQWETARNTLREMPLLMVTDDWTETNASN